MAIVLPAPPHPSILPLPPTPAPAPAVAPDALGVGELQILFNNQAKIFYFGGPQVSDAQERGAAIRGAFHLPAEAQLLLLEQRMQPAPPAAQYGILSRHVPVSALESGSTYCLHSDIWPEVQFVPHASLMRWVNRQDRNWLEKHLKLHGRGIRHVPDEVVTASVQVATRFQMRELGNAAEPMGLLTLTASASFGVISDQAYDCHGEHWYMTGFDMMFHMCSPYENMLCSYGYSPTNEEKTVTQTTSTGWNAGVALNAGAAGPVPAVSLMPTFGYHSDASSSTTDPVFSTRYEYRVEQSQPPPPSPPGGGLPVPQLNGEVGECDRWQIELRSIGKNKKPFEFNSDRPVDCDEIPFECFGQKKKDFSKTWLVNLRRFQNPTHKFGVVVVGILWLHRNEAHNGRQLAEAVRQISKFHIYWENSKLQVDELPVIHDCAEVTLGTVAANAQGVYSLPDPVWEPIVIRTHLPSSGFSAQPQPYVVPPGQPGQPPILSGEMLRTTP